MTNSFIDKLYIQKMKKIGVRKVIRKSKRSRTKAMDRKMKKDIEDLIRKIEKLSILPPNYLPFPITDTKLDGLKRMNPTQNDCVINAFEILGVMDSREAALSRAFHNNRPIGMDKIVETMNAVGYPHQHKFELVNDATFADVMNELKPGNSIFAGITWEGVGTGHVILLAKGVDRINYVLDPQISEHYPNAPRVGTYLYKFNEYPLQKPTRIYILCTNVRVKQPEKMIAE